MLLREAKVSDAVFNAFKGALTVRHASPRTNQLDGFGIVNIELTVSQVSQMPAQRQGPGAVVSNTLVTTVTIPNSKSRNVLVRRVTHTKRIMKLIKGTSKRVTFRSVSV